MSDFDPQEVVLRLFLRLRSNLKLGVSEYLAARQAAVEADFAADAEALEDTLKLIWCHSLIDYTQFDPAWQSVLAQVQAQRRRRPPFPERRRAASDLRQRQIESVSQQQSPVAMPQMTQREKRSDPEMRALPVQAPTLFMPEENVATLQSYYPISRRSLVYNWRYLRRPVADGPKTVLDIAATVQQSTRQGFYLAPVYVRKLRNAARLLLLIDQNGSMTPFHHFTRDLVETASKESSLDPENVEAYYFQNVPAGSVFRDPYLTMPVLLAEALATCDESTSVLVLSDAGAARGYRMRDRVRGTIRFLQQLKRYTTLLAWLNPMPESRWEGSSAEVIAQSVPMFQMDNEGLSNAIDVVRGQPLKHGNAGGA
ncbi:VWA containing CoxE family protein [Nodosilinea sp. LEGE 07298]|uniref:VWA containing CoxE family protein n=1 Tax=Nodosilinea sp. LEGE 07298 TaxID=2777970 RepID=UPI00188234E5|nr:VWA containing CoxE family protein [Nodosilinea sp. LEGE 07298]MBE9112493.1 VWA containing CoxE family protein [Nodosilinea sp. LEGE 07298]